MKPLNRALNAIDKTGGVALFEFPAVSTRECPSLESLIDDDVGNKYYYETDKEISMPNNISKYEKVRAVNFVDKDRRYKVHHVARIEYIEVRKDSLASCVLTGGKKNCIIYLGGKQ